MESAWGDVLSVAESSVPRAVTLRVSRFQPKTLSEMTSIGRRGFLKGPSPAAQNHKSVGRAVQRAESSLGGDSEA